MFINEKCVADQQLVTPSTQVSSNQPRSCAAATFLPVATKLLRDLTLFVYLLSFCSFSFFSLPALSRSSLAVLPPVPGSTAPRLQSSPNAIRIHGSSPPRTPSTPRTSPQLPALRSLRRIYTPASSLRVPRLQISPPRSSWTLDRAPSVVSVFPLFD